MYFIFLVNVSVVDDLEIRNIVYLIDDEDDIKIIHLKDFLVDGDKLVQTGLGKGILDYNFIIKSIKKYAPNATLIFEGVVGDDIEPSLKLIKSLL